LFCKPHYDQCGDGVVKVALFLVVIVCQHDNARSVWDNIMESPGHRASVRSSDEFDNDWGLAHGWWWFKIMFMSLLLLRRMRTLQNLHLFISYLHTPKTMY